MTEENNSNNFFAVGFAVIVFLSFIQTIIFYNIYTAIQIITLQYLTIGCLFYAVIKISCNATKQESPQLLKFIFLWYPAIFSDKLKVQMYKRE